MMYFIFQSPIPGSTSGHDYVHGRSQTVEIYQEACGRQQTPQFQTERVSVENHLENVFPNPSLY